MAKEEMKVTDAAYELIEHMESEAKYIDVVAGLALVTSLIVSGFLGYFMIYYVQTGAYGTSLPFIAGLLVSLVWLAVSVKELLFLGRWRARLELLRKREKQIVDEVLT
jgi:membrane protein implicated in regulation of membrane protease activity